MEQLWKDITLTLTTSTHSSPHEFLASPAYPPSPPTQSCDPQPASWSTSPAACSKKVSQHHHHYSGPSQQLYGSCLCSQSSLAPSSSLFPLLCSCERESADHNACSDRRYKRKMKNRESATRSRARRQAYMNELELELAHLREENAMLKRRQEEICSAAAAAAAAAAHQPKKSTLLRSLTAPF
uniref:BZIP domain-containing protein n=1 Tax=Kalanchoe fedtschenkoi TaxID=63787 RepID=A0A7N0UJH0_KALFE